MNKPPPPPPRINKPLKSKSSSSNKSSNGGTSSSGATSARERGKVLKIFFGTQTRTAEDFSHVIEKEAKKIGIPCEVVDLETYDPEDLASEYFAMFVVATHGEGDPTDNAKDFYLWLTSTDREAGMLKDLPYCVFGLGNKTYEHYNAVARVFDKKLEDLGAKRVFERGEGDDDATLEEDFIHWKKRMWVGVCEFLGYELKSTDDDKFVPRFRMIKLTSESTDVEKSYCKIVAPKLKPKMSNDNKVIHDIKNPFSATLTENSELHGSESDRSCRHLEFDVGSSSITYSTGDHLGVYPINETVLVDQLLKRLEVDGDTFFALVPNESAGSVIEASFGPMTLRKAFTEHLDITNPPRKSVLRALVDYTNDPEEKQKLLKLSSDENSEEYNQFIKHDFRTIGEILTNFPNVRPPISHFLELLPPLPARYYSISSSPNTKPGRITITSVVVNFTTPTNRFHNGVASTWMANLKVGDRVPIFVRESHFRLPSYFTSTTSSPSVGAEPAKIPPMIMVGPGTGLAPFRGFLQEIKYRMEKDQIQQTVESVLFFGCRADNIDYLYKDELKQYQADGVLNELFVAFSRQNREKVYVQHKIMEQKQKIWDLLSRGAHFYICGDARNMAKSVQQSLLTIIKEEGSKDDNAAQQYLEDMQKSNRFLQDVWF
eukprot:gene5286-6579_t